MKRLFLAALVCSVHACRCGPPPRPLAPQLEVLEDMSAAERTSVDFGFVQVNLTGTQKVRIRNGGTAVLQLTQVDTMPEQFGVVTTLPLEIAAGDEGQLELTFTPTVPDQRITGTATLSSNDAERSTYTLQLAGQGVTAVARAQPTTLDFQDVYVGESKTLTLTLTNAGGNALPVRGASLTGSPLGVTGNFTALADVTLPPGGSESVTVTFAPMGQQMGPISGAVEIDIDAMFGGSVTVPVTGRATQALPRMCFKFDDEAMEQCTDSITTSLNLRFGALCDNRIYATGPGACTPQNGQRTGQLYFRNEGNVPVPYSASFKPYNHVGARCPDGGLPSSDFVFSNVPVPDAGPPAELVTGTSSLPMNEMAPRPWESMPITITYRATSGCIAEAADQAQIIWTRQDPPATMPIRTPGTLFATLSGSSLLPAAKPKPVNIGQQGQPADVPFSTPLAVELVTNEGLAPLTLQSVELWEELPFFLPDGGTADGGGPNGGILSLCNLAAMDNPFSNCSRFQWAPGDSPADNLPVTLDGGGTPQSPSQAVVGRMFLGCLADGGQCPPNETEYRIVAIVNTSDPYAPRVPVTVKAVVRARQ